MQACTFFYLFHTLSWTHFVILLLCCGLPRLNTLPECFPLPLKQSLVFPICI